MYFWTSISADAARITVCNGNVTCVQLMHNILNHEMQMNNMYLFYTSQTTDNLHYKDQLLDTVYEHKLYI